MTKAKLIRTAMLAALFVMMTGIEPARTSEPTRVTQTISISGDAAAQFVPLGVGKTVIVDLPRDVKDVLVADPRYANAVIRTARRAYIIGVAVGQTNIFFFDADGRQIAGFDIAVTRDLNGIRAALKRLLPDLDIKVEGLADGIMLAGSVASPTEAQQAYDLAARLAGDGNKVVNGLTVRGRDQVMLKVTVAEVSRDVIKQLGIDLSGSLNYGSAVVNFNTTNPFSATGQALSSSSLVGKSALNGLGVPSVQTTLRAMERAGVIRTLAEPNLTAISGETASFMAGGEFPIPNGLSCDTTKSPPVCQAQVEFKKFGVSLMFTPVVLTEGRISLKVMTEVSDMSNQNSMTMGVPGASTTLTIPSIRTRRADTVVEIPSGGSLAMAGMIQQLTQQSIDGSPGLMQEPILGSLF
jgi:pilus assembly protein CpaC